MKIGVVGGGIVGLAAAYRIQERFPRAQVLLFEKEPTLAAHQSGRNSGVLHSGIYYRPGSLKAINCRAGKRALEAFCEAEGLPFERCGKVIVATHRGELAWLEELHRRGQANGVTCHRIGPEQLRQLEPYVQGIAALHVPETGIVDFQAVCQRLALRIQERGGQVHTARAVLRAQRSSRGWVLLTPKGEVEVDVAVLCAGLDADRLLERFGYRARMRIIPFRGEFYWLRPESSFLCRNLIYPVPDPRFPFAGVHLTRTLTGRVKCGPNAVLALAREGYRWREARLADMADYLCYPGFWRMAARYWRVGLEELWRSWSRNRFCRAVQRLVPAVRPEDLIPAPSGVRAQAVDRNGSLVDDFVLDAYERLLHVANAPSPAATSALQVGWLLADWLARSGWLS
ncbi:MAG: L-2-hydroxyglutarate oxidase [Bacteroidota bacterium]|nr:L-2-hydroxyglutarate oxidase [Bacteroidota bacterium]